jgi:hypothetical protein
LIKQRTTAHVRKLEMVTKTPIVIVMAYESLIGNCLRLNLNGHLVSSEVVTMQRMYALVPFTFLVIISPSIILVVSYVTIN